MPEKQPKQIWTNPFDENPPTRERLEKFARNGKGKFTYHMGLLSEDRESDPEVEALAVRALELANAGVFALTQRRLFDGAFAYIAERRP